MPVHQLHALAAVDEYNTLGIPESIAETEVILQAWIQANQREDERGYTFVIRQLTNQAFVGLIALNLSNKKYNKGEVWYKLHPNHWGQGFATEALSKVLDFGFDTLKLHRVEAGCAVDNIGSVKVLEKVGMIKEGRKRAILPLKSGWADSFSYAINETDPRANR